MIEFIIGIVKFVLVFLIFVFGTYSSPNPPSPEIKYGEFPISIEYEFEGEYNYIKDIVVCEFDGFEVRGTSKERKWNEYLKSGTKRLVLLQIDDTTELFYAFLPADYYMGEFKYSTKAQYEESSYDLTLRRKQNDIYVDYVYEQISFAEAEELYNIKIISVNYSEPITNSFSE